MLKFTMAASLLAMTLSVDAFANDLDEEGQTGTETTHRLTSGNYIEHRQANESAISDFLALPPSRYREMLPEAMYGLLNDNSRSSGAILLNPPLAAASQHYQPNRTQYTEMPELGFEFHPNRTQYTEMPELGFWFFPNPIIRSNQPDVNLKATLDPQAIARPAA